MAFRREKDMLPILSTCIDKVVGNGVVFLAREVAVGRRVIDLVAATFPDRPERLMLGKAVRNLSMVDLDVLSLFAATTRVSIRKLSRLLGLTPRSIHERYLGRFMQAELIYRVTRYSYAAGEWRHGINVTLTAIEAKLDGWEQALDQATYNRRYTDLSFVALDGDRVTLTREQMTAFRKAGVGILYVYSTGEITLDYFPRRLQAPNHHKWFQRIKVVRDCCLGTGRWVSAACQEGGDYVGV